MTEDQKIENTQDFVKVMAQLMIALEDRELDADEGAALTKTAAALLDRCRPLFRKWWQRALLDSASSALRECSSHLETLNK